MLPALLKSLYVRFAVSRPLYKRAALRPILKCTCMCWFMSFVAGHHLPALDFVPTRTASYWLRRACAGPYSQSGEAATLVAVRSPSGTGTGPLTRYSSVGHIASKCWNDDIKDSNSKKTTYIWMELPPLHFTIQVYLWKTQLLIYHFMFFCLS